MDRDVPLRVRSAQAISERRITPAWSIAQLKAKLVSVTGIPAASQRLELRLPNQGPEPTVVVLEAVDETTVQVAHFPLVPYAELNVTSTDPNALPPSFDLSADAAVPKVTMPVAQYEALPNTVRAFKERNRLGRFDPEAAAKTQSKVALMTAQIEERGISIGRRCHLIFEETRRGSVRFVGPIDGLPGPAGAPWVGIEFDEPVGKSDGSVEVELESDDGELNKSRIRLFQCKDKFGTFVRPERVIVGEFPPLDELEEM